MPGYSFGDDFNSMMVLVCYITPNVSRLPWIPWIIITDGCPVCKTLKTKKKKRTNSPKQKIDSKSKFSMFRHINVCITWVCLHAGTFCRDLNRESKGGPFSPKRLAGKQILLWNCLICILTCSLSHTRHTQKHLTLHHDVVPVPPRGLQALAGVRNTLQSRD